MIPENLPLTLADAVKTTRLLGIRYLWVDTLCIIQDSKKDWMRESDRMATVYSMAYCVLAATSADGTSTEFLERKSTGDAGTRQERDSVCFPFQAADGSPGGHIVVAKPFDNFEQDVLKGPLNQRGWVFQERACARRTIHFSNQQTYWECGQGIRCESLTMMQNQFVGFLGDPNFPTYGISGSKGLAIAFYEDLYERYSRLSLSRDTDRPFAISSLEQRLVKALRDKTLREKRVSSTGYWGVFDEFWGRGLLWRRDADTPKMIRLKVDDRDRQPAPSWSWEGHSGGISFMKPEPHTVIWLSKEVTLPWKHRHHDSASTTSYHGDTFLRGIARDFRLPVLKKGQDAQTISSKMDIRYDDDEALDTRRPLKTLIVGRMDVKERSLKEVRNYVLIIAKKKESGDNVYESVGAGYLHGSLISFHNDAHVLVE